MDKDYRIDFGGINKEFKKLLAGAGRPQSVDPLFKRGWRRIEELAVLGNGDRGVRIPCGSLGSLLDVITAIKWTFTERERFRPHLHNLKIDAPMTLFSSVKATISVPSHCSASGKAKLSGLWPKQEGGSGNLVTMNIARGQKFTITFKSVLIHSIIKAIRGEATAIATAKAAPAPATIVRTPVTSLADYIKMNAAQRTKISNINNALRAEAKAKGLVPPKKISELFGVTPGQLSGMVRKGEPAPVASSPKAKAPKAPSSSTEPASVDLSLIRELAGYVEQGLMSKEKARALIG